MPTSGSDTAANSLLTSLTSGVSFTVPAVDLSDAVYTVPAASGPLYGTITRLNNAALTTQIVGGTGTFDVLMASVKAHLKAEYDANRITGSEYTKAYIALTEAALSNATQYLLAQEQAYWTALGAQAQAQAASIAVVTGRVQLQTAKTQLQAMVYEAANNQASYALNKAKLATEDATYGTAIYQLNNLLPKQLDLVKEQVETQRSQTLDTRTDGTTAVTGSVGKQKALYAQQILSYQRDAEVKAAKIFSDAWITMKTIDEGLLPPTGFDNTTIAAILASLKTNNSL
jgi:hypothetical protein